MDVKLVDMNKVELITIITAIIGASLGIINSINQFFRSKIRLDIKPVQIYNLGTSNGKDNFLKISKETKKEIDLTITDREYLWGIEITNIGVYEVIVYEVGFGNYRKIRSMIQNPPIMGENGTLPRTVKPFESITCTLSGKLVLKKYMINKPFAYVYLGGNRIKYGTSDVFKKYIKEHKRSV